MTSITEREEDIEELLKSDEMEVQMPLCRNVFILRRGGTA